MSAANWPRTGPCSTRLPDRLELEKGVELRRRRARRAGARVGAAKNAEQRSHLVERLAAQALHAREARPAAGLVVRAGRREADHLLEAQARDGVEVGCEAVAVDLDRQCGGRLALPAQLVGAFGPPTCESHVAIGGSMLVFTGNPGTLTNGTGISEGATGRVVSSKSVPGQEHASDVVVRITLRP